MKPSTLRPGMQVRRSDRPDGPLLTFVRRSDSRRLSVLQCDAYRGLDGPDDEGLVHVSDWDMTRKYARVADSSQTASQESGTRR